MEKNYKKNLKEKEKKQYFDKINIELRKVRLYLVSELGPTSFLFKTDDKLKIRIDIGKKNHCSLCKSIYNDFNCVHIIHCLIKIFKVETMDLLVNRNLSKKNIDNILEKKFNNNFNNNNNIVTLPNINKFKKAQQKNINEQEICPICHDNINNQIKFCECCGYNFHTDCLIIWIEHNIKKENFNCPMCRGKWKSSPKIILDNLKNEMLKGNIKEKMHKKKCICNKFIIGDIFKCLQCYNLYFCKKCFKTLKGKKNNYDHLFFLHKNNNKEKWNYLKLTFNFNFVSIEINYSKNIFLFFKELMICNRNNKNNNEFSNILITNKLFNNINKCVNCTNKGKIELNCDHFFCDICFKIVIKKKKCLKCFEVISNGFLLILKDKKTNPKFKPLTLKKIN